MNLSSALGFKLNNFSYFRPYDPSYQELAKRFSITKPGIAFGFIPEEDGTFTWEETSYTIIKDSTLLTTIDSSTFAFATNPNGAPTTTTVEVFPFRLYGVLIEANETNFLAYGDSVPGTTVPYSLAVLSDRRKIWSTEIETLMLEEFVEGQLLLSVSGNMSIYLPLTPSEPSYIVYLKIFNTKDINDFKGKSSASLRPAIVPTIVIQPLSEFESSIYLIGNSIPLFTYQAVNTGEKIVISISIEKRIETEIESIERIYTMLASM